MTDTYESLDETKITKASAALEKAFDALRRKHEPQHFLLYFGVLFAQGLEWLDSHGHKQVSD